MAVVDLFVDEYPAWGEAAAMFVVLSVVDEGLDLLWRRWGVHRVVVGQSRFGQAATRGGLFLLALVLLWAALRYVLPTN